MPIDLRLRTINIAEVVNIVDNTEGGRIQARILPDDAKTKNSELPYCFPLLPKMLHIIPKVGEAVLVFTLETNNANSDRFYLGPIISQPQFMYKDNFNTSALSLLKGSIKMPEKALSTNPNTHGSLPENSDIAICGRMNSDIILTDNDVRIRSGAHLVDEANKQNIQFNKNNPSYIKVKFHTKPLSNNNQSSVSIVGDEINLLSTASMDQFKLTDKTDLITDEEMNTILEKAHVLPYGDKLVEFLELFVKAFKTHTHPYSGLPPCTDSTYIAVDEYNLNDILSKNVRIN